MKLCLSFDPEATVELLLKEVLEDFEIPSRNITATEITLDNATDKERARIVAILNKYQISIITDKLDKMISDVMKHVRTMVYENSQENISDYLQSHMKYSYANLSSIFKERQGYTISEYVYFIKITRAMNLFVNQNKTLTEIAYELQYSSVAHLSRQFKKVTGLNFSTYQMLIERRKENTESC